MQSRLFALLRLRILSATALSIVAAAVASACSASADADPDVPAAYKKLIADGRVQFVLSRAEQQTGEDIVIFDHQCTSGRIKSTLRDTIVLSSDGQFNRAYNIRREANGLVNQSPGTMSGTWRLNPNWRKSRRDGASLFMRSGANGAPGEAEFWLVDANTLELESSVGGSCPGSANDARSIYMYYTRR